MKKSLETGLETAQLHTKGITYFVTYHVRSQVPAV